jgi:hypothetical protein
MTLELLASIEMSVKVDIRRAYSLKAYLTLDRASDGPLMVLFESREWGRFSEARGGESGATRGAASGRRTQYAKVGS